MDFSSSSTSWLHAYKTGSSLNTDSLSATISQHAENGMGTFSFDSTAQGGTDTNPFVSSSSNGTSGTSGSSGTTTTVMVSGSGAAPQRIIVIHASLACVAFAIIFPLGGIMIRALNFAGLMWAHAVMQILGYFLYVAAVGLGLYFAMNPDVVSDFVKEQQYRNQKLIILVFYREISQTSIQS
jgi:hypothetical protein